MRQLILGGARSGKSRLAERLAIASGRQVIFVATAEALDDEMSARIAHHRRHRPASWHTIEEPLRLAALIDRHRDSEALLLIDCLTLWLSNLLHRVAEPMKSIETFCRAIENCRAELLMVSNETGLGVIPGNPLSRRFVDAAGRLHQGLASRCDRVILTVAGLPHVLKGPPCDAD